MQKCKYLEHNFELCRVFSSRTRSQLLQKRIKVNCEEKDVEKKGQKVGKKSKKCQEKIWNVVKNKWLFPQGNVLCNQVKP